MISLLYKFNKELILLLLLLIVLTIFLSAWFPATKSIGIVFGGLGILFIPGYFFTYVSFPEPKPLHTSNSNTQTLTNTLDKIERIILSLFLSMTLIALSLTLLRTFNFTLSPKRVVVIISLINIFAIVGAWIKYKKLRS